MLPAVLDLPAGIAPPTPEQAAAIAARTAAPDFALWERELAQLGCCANPVHLRGTVAHLDRATGELREVFTTTDRAGGTLRVRCGSRLAAKCPACAWTYQQDAFHLLRAGLTGDLDKGIPATVAEHPRLFVTLTGPSFGPVHSREATSSGRARPCHPRDGAAATCPHGRRLDCRARHREDDPRLGEPLCPGCYDYQRAVLFNALAPELWRRTIEYAYRHLARTLGVTATGARKLVRISYAKVAEWQARGAIHFHAILRLDAATPAAADTPAPPPSGLTAAHLRAAIQWAAANVPAPDATALVCWGNQLDLRDLTAERHPGRTLTAEQVAGYVAKYATKSTAETFGPSSPGPSTTPATSSTSTISSARAREHRRVRAGFPAIPAAA
jgi:hypothetical protein